MYRTDLIGCAMACDELLWVNWTRKSGLYKNNSFLETNFSHINYTKCRTNTIIFFRKIVNSHDNELVIGFDMEWPFSFQTGPGKTALIQISPNLDIAYLLHVSGIKNLPANLCEFLAHPKVRLTGNNIKKWVKFLCTLNRN